MARKDGDRLDMALKIIVSLDQVTKSFKGHFWEKKQPILSEITLDIEEGRVIGIIGHNGAGKTSLFKIMTGLISPDKGSVTFGKRMGAKPRNSIGFLPENPYFYKHLTALESLSFYASLFDGLQLTDSDLSDALVQVGLPEKVHHQRLNNFSKGMLQRFGFAQALINDPLLIILDEPMSGLDPAGRKDIRGLIENLKRSGKTIIFSSHILDDVEKLCDSVVLFDEGRVVKRIDMDVILGKSSWCVDYSLNNNSTANHLMRDIVQTKKDLHHKIKSVIQAGGTIENIERVIPPLEEWIDRRVVRGEKV